MLEQTTVCAIPMLFYGLGADTDFRLLQYYDAELRQMVTGLHSGQGVNTSSGESNLKTSMPRPRDLLAYFDFLNRGFLCLLAGYFFAGVVGIVRLAFEGASFQR